MAAINRAKTWPMSGQEAYSLAHTAECKLRMAANHPERNLRFLLGHAMTLDKLTLRIVQIEEEQDLLEQENQKSMSPSQGRRVSFSTGHRDPGTGEQRGEPKKTREKSPPPPTPALHDDVEVDDFDDDDGEEEDGGGLMRFQSASAMPPRSFDDVRQPEPEDDSESEEDEEEPKSPPQDLFSEDTLREIVGEEDDEDLSTLYQSIQACGCQKQKDEKQQAPVIQHMWKVPGAKETEQHQVPQYAIVAV